MTNSRREKLITRRELADFFRVHMMTITKWERDGLPIAERGRRGRPSRYSRTAAKAWLRAREKAAKDGGQVDVARERAMKEKSQTLLNEQLYEVRAGDLLPAEDIEQAWAKQIVGARAVLLSLPMTFAARIHSAATREGVAGVEHALQEAVKEVLRELADPGRDVVKRPPSRKKATKASKARKSSRKSSR